MDSALAAFLRFALSAYAAAALMRAAYLFLKEYMLGGGSGARALVRSLATAGRASLEPAAWDAANAFPLAAGAVLVRLLASLAGGGPPLGPAVAAEGLAWLGLWWPVLAVLWGIASQARLMLYQRRYAGSTAVLPESLRRTPPKMPGA